MRITKYAAVFVAAGALLLAGCSSSGDSPKSNSQKPVENVSFEPGTTMARIHDSGKFVVGTKFDQPLTGLVGPDGVPQGFDTEIARILASELGLTEDQIEWRETVSANREPFIQKGEVDIVVATYTINDERKKVVSFAGPYVVVGQDILVLDGNPEKIKGVDDLKDKKVCAVTGSNSTETLQSYGIDVLTTDSYSNCLEPLRSGDVSAVSTDNIILGGLAAQNPGEFEVVENPFTEEPYGIAFKKDDTDFQTFINDSLERAFADGRWEQAWKDTAGEVLSTPAVPTILPVN